MGLEAPSVKFSLAKSAIISSLLMLACVRYLSYLFYTPMPMSDINTDAAPSLYKKCVVLVLDGVRADTIFKTDKNTKYHNNFPFLETVKKENVFKALSETDYPTGTAMRIMSTFSGVQTTLFDTQKSFKKQKCVYDSFIKQVLRSNKTLAFYGDETWRYLFPEIAPHIKFDYHAFGLVPLDEEKAIMDEILIGFGEKDVSIVHFISPDSYGHVYGVDSDEVQKSLAMMNAFIENMYNRMDPDTFLAVISDHGVNNDGSHGGTSYNETASIAVFITKDGFKHSPSARSNTSTASNGATENQNTTDPSAIDPKIPEPSATDPNVASQNVAEHKTQQSNYDVYRSTLSITEPFDLISQHDVLPTLCALLGIPTPINAIGHVVEKIIPHSMFPKHTEVDILRKETRLKTLRRRRDRRKTGNGNTTEKKTGAEINKELSLELHKMHRENHAKGMIATSIWLSTLLVSYLIVFKVNPSQPYSMVVLLISFFSMFMVAHSVYSIIHEDVLCIFAILVLMALRINRESLPYQFYLLPLSLLVGSFPLHSEDRFRYVKWIGKLPEKLEVPSLKYFVYMGLAAVILKYLFEKYVQRKDTAVPVHYVYGLSACVKILEEKEASSLWVLPLMVFVPDTLLFAVYPALSALFLLYFFKPTVNYIIHAKECYVWKGSLLYFILKLMFFVTNHNHKLSSINWKAAFIFSAKAIPVFSPIFVIIDVFYPYMYVAYSIYDKEIGSATILLFLQGATVALSFFINFWFLHTSLLWFIFAGRTIFEFMFFMFCLILHCLLSLKADLINALETKTKLL